MKSVCWFRNDLRVLDNPALHHSCLNSDEVIGIYFLNRKQWLEHNDAAVKINFWLRNLECLQNELKKLNVSIIIASDPCFISFLVINIFGIIILKPWVSGLLYTNQ